MNHTTVIESASKNNNEIYSGRVINFRLSSFTTPQLSHHTLVNHLNNEPYRSVEERLSSSCSTLLPSTGYRRCKSAWMDFVIIFSAVYGKNAIHRFSVRTRRYPLMRDILINQTVSNPIAIIQEVPYLEMIVRAALCHFSVPASSYHRDHEGC